VLQQLTSCSKLVDNLGQAVRTQRVDGLLADSLQDARFLRMQLYYENIDVQTQKSQACQQVVTMLLFYQVATSCHSQLVDKLSNCRLGR
jgi:hypothetical protein